MSEKISFEGIGLVCATFCAGEGVEEGQVVKLGGNAEVQPCGDGERFCGVAGRVREGYVPVQVGGLIRLACADGTVTAGYVKLSADGNGGVKKDDESGQEYLVVDVESDAVTVRL